MALERRKNSDDSDQFAPAAEELSEPKMEMYHKASDYSDFLNRLPPKNPGNKSHRLNSPDSKISFFRQPSSKFYEHFCPYFN